MGGVGDEGVWMGMGGFVHADVPVGLTGNVSVGHGERTCDGTRRGGKADKRRRMVIYI